MHIKVDQSGRIEQPVDTVLAFSDTIDFAILIPREVKRNILKYLRENLEKDKETAAVIVFAAGTFLLIREMLTRIDYVEIDEEFTGKEATIKGILMRLARQRGIELPKRMIGFGRIGKTAGAHKRAIAVTRGQSKPERYVTEAELFALIK
jgi:hypothetical protein